MTLTVTDLFCGGGGSSTGAVAVPGLEIRIAANHWDLAVEVHNENHPTADHAAVDLHEENPAFFPSTDVLWASPECTKWSQASGGKYSAIDDGDDLLSLLDPDLVDEDPETAVVRRSRLLMFDVLRFAEHHRYRAMVIENVVDIATNARYRDAWTLWRKKLSALGYHYRVVSFNAMHASTHGAPAPQSRDRVYIVCWRKGDRTPDIDSVLRPAAWCPQCAEVVESQQSWKPGRTVGKYRAQYVYVHAACGTVVEPAYLPAAAAIDWALPGTRIGDRAKPLADKTRRRIAAGIARHWGPVHVDTSNRQRSTVPTTEPLHTLAPDNSHGLVLPLEGRAGDRCSSVADPLRSMTTRHQDGFVTKAEFGGQDWSLAEPNATQTTYDTASVSQPPLVAELRGGGSTARPAADPLSTVTASGNHHALVSRHNSSPGHGAEMTTPVTEWLRTLTTTGHQSLLMPYYGSSTSATPVTKPVGTLTTVDRYALIQPTPKRKLTEADIRAAADLVDDAYFRMLEPSEVALGMAFPGDYIWRGSRRQRVKLAGNAVCPPCARDLLHPIAAALGTAA